MSEKPKLPECPHCGKSDLILLQESKVIDYEGNTTGEIQREYACPECLLEVSTEGEIPLFTHATAKLEASEAQNAEMLAALEEISNDPPDHYDFPVDAYMCSGCESFRKRGEPEIVHKDSCYILKIRTIIAKAKGETK